MNSPTLVLALPLLLKLGAVLLLIAALELGLRRAAPRWRVLLLRGALVVTPLVIAAALAPALVEVPKPWGEEPAAPSSMASVVIPSLDFAEIEASPARTANPAPAPDPIWFHPGFWLALVWGLGTLGLLLREACQLQRLRHRVRAAVPAPDRLRDVWQRVASASGLPPAEILASADRQSPFLWPGRRCRLVVPACLAEERREVLEHVFHHEAAHLKHRDPAWILAYRVFVALLWWLPLVPWFAARHLRACEEACDAEAARRGGVDDYRETLAGLALRLLPVKASATAAFLRPPSVRKRLEAVLGNAGKRGPRGWAMALAALALVVASGAIGNAVWAQKEASEALANESRGDAALQDKVWMVQIGELYESGEVENIRAKDWLEEKGIEFGFMAGAIYDPKAGQLIVRNTSAELDKISGIFSLDGDSYIDGDTKISLSGENLLFSKNLLSHERLRQRVFPPFTGLEDGIIRIEAIEGQERIQELRMVLANTIVHEVTFIEKPLVQCVEFLAKLVGEETPVNIGIPEAEWDGVPVEDAPVTLSFRDIPLGEAFHHTASAAGLRPEVRADGIALVQRQQVE